ncbi:MAG: DinB family protein, partial [Bacteroidota bacterium]
MDRLPWIERIFQLDLPPAWLPNILNRLEGTTVRLQHYAHLTTERDAGQQIDGKWSIKQHIGHLVDLESLHIGRIADFRSGASILRAADMSNRATELADHNQQSIEILIAQFGQQRQDFIQQLKGLPQDVQQLSIPHPRLNQVMRPVDLAFFTAEHDDHH